MPGLQRILLVSTGAGEVELAQLRGDLGRDPVVVAPPTVAAERVVGVLGVEPHVEPLLAPVEIPGIDRSHRLDDLVRRYALQDRFKDVVVVADPTTSALLLRALAPDQVSAAGVVTTVGLARGGRPVAVGRAVASGFVLGVAAIVLEPLTPILMLPGAVALVGLSALLALRWRHLGQELLLAAAIAVMIVIVVVAGSARFPAAADRPSQGERCRSSGPEPAHDVRGRDDCRCGEVQSLGVSAHGSPGRLRA